MSNSKVSKILKISDLMCKNEDDINRITYNNAYLISCEYSIKEEEIEFTYNTENLKEFSSLKKSSITEKLRALIGVADLEKIAHIYSFKISEENLYYDYNYSVKILERDINEQELIDYENMVLEYKSLIGYLFNDKYTFDDFYKGGIDLVKLNKITEKYLQLSTIDEIKEQLLLDLKENEKIQKEKYIQISKKEYTIKKYSIWIMSAFLCILFGYFIYSFVFLNPLNKKVIKANSAYLVQDYELIIKNLENTRGMKLDKESKFKLAYSYVISENLSEAQKKNILANLNLNTDENILDYWISIGKSKYDEALDLGRKVQDSELVLYALLHKDKSIQDNTKMTGEEKQQEQENIKSEIEKIKKELTDTNMFENNDSEKSTEGDGESQSKESSDTADTVENELNLNPNGN